jgi:hypothetical protein
MPRRNRNGDPGKLAAVRHYKGKRGAERLVSVLMSSGVVAYYEGKRGAEHYVRRELPTGAVLYYEGKAGAEYLVRIKRCPSTGAVIYSSRVSAATYMCF